MSEKTKLVFIDDEPDLCEMVKTVLEATGNFEVVTSSDSKNAENFIREQNPQLILLDVVMPDRRGDDIAKAIKKDSELKQIPIVIVSGKGQMVYLKKKNEFKWMPNNPATQFAKGLPEAKSAEALSQAYGVDDYISKPFTTEIMVQVIEDVLKRTRKTGEEPKEEPLV